jgi:hypothetical protein
MCKYSNVLADQFPILQEVIVRSRQISAERSTSVEDEVGAVQAELGNEAEAPGGPYVNTWNGVSATLDTSQTVSYMLGRIAEKVKKMMAAPNQVTLRANKGSSEVGGVRSLVTGLEVKQRAEANKSEEIRGHIYQLTVMLVALQQEQRSHIASFGGTHQVTATSSSMVNGIPVEDVVAQLQLELQMV